MPRGLKDGARARTAMMQSTNSQNAMLVLNAGSSSIKFAVYAIHGADCSLAMKGKIEGIGIAPRMHARRADGAPVGGVPRIDARTSVHRLMEILIDWLETHFGAGGIAATGHRVVLGGLDHSKPMLIDAALMAQLRALIPLAPVHQPRNLEPIVALARLNPTMPQVACFDTAFHRTMPEVAQLYGLPRHLSEAGARRFGFHGLSYEYVAGRLKKVDPRAAQGRTVVAHLGNGASMCAMVDGKSVATTMGFSPLSGLLMGTRPGELDPGIMLWLMQTKGMSLEAVETMLYHDCGLKGVSGVSSDMRDLLASGDPHAKQAIALFVYRICHELGALAAASGGIDALVFTGGIGESAAEVREAVCRQSAWLGIALDGEANVRGAGRIDAPDSRVAVWVIPTDEEGVIARHTVGILTHMTPLAAQ
jgi:acetate kinase